jgi:Xaa-Pro aminopeptidase
MAALKVDGVFIYSDVNRNYITGFTGDDSYIVVTSSNAVFITDSRYTEQAENQVVDFQVKDHEGKLIPYITGLIRSLGIQRLGFESSNMIYDMYVELKKELAEIEFVSLEGAVENLRQIKDEGEVEKIARAQLIADEAFTHILGFIKPGMTEKEIGLELEFYMRKKGASGLSFDSIVASGKRSSLPHGTATSKTVEKGDFLTLDFGCVYDGYCSDMTRTVVIGRATERQKELYSIVLEANNTALMYVKPGITGAELDEIARKVIENKGYGKYFGHSLGHGVGMMIHELPHISKKNCQPIKPGMIITDEPGIYIPGYGGVRIEDLLLVTEDGCRVLSKSTKELIEIL